MAILKVLVLFSCVFSIKGDLHHLIQIPENTPNVGRIVQGSPANPGQFPHQVHLQLYNSGGSIYCGGSIISVRHVLTAAHCVVGRNSVNVRMGTTSLSSGTVMTSNQLTWHPQYNSNMLYNDVGIITMPSNIPLSNNIQIIRLPKLSDLSNTYEGRVARVAGWGRTTDNGAISQSLLWTDMNVISNQRCAQEYIPELIISSTLCASGIQSASQGTCQGDSGGCLYVTESDGIATQIGVVSFVSSWGCTSAISSGFARVTHFLTWINDITGIPIRQ